MISPLMIPIVIFTVGPISAIMFPVARAFARRIERGVTPGPDNSDTTLRLERMEQAIEAIAVEVERVSEGQRFTTKLLSDRATTPQAVTPADSARVAP